MAYRASASCLLSSQPGKPKQQSAPCCSLQVRYGKFYAWYTYMIGTREICTQFTSLVSIYEPRVLRIHVLISHVYHGYAVPSSTYLRCLAVECTKLKLDFPLNIFRVWSHDPKTQTHRRQRQLDNEIYHLSDCLTD